MKISTPFSLSLASIKHLFGRAIVWCMAGLFLFSVQRVQADTYDTELQELYVAYYGRPADPVGLTYWNNVIANAVAAGQDVDTALDSVRDSFGATEEYLANFDNLTSVQKIARIYNNLFSHDPDPTGLVYWANRLESGELTIGQISKIIADTARQDDTNVDGIAFNSKVTAAKLFTNALDSTVEIVGYSGVAAGNLAKAFISRINSAETLATETTPAALTATVTAVTDAGNTIVASISSVTGPVSGSYKTGQSLNFTVTYYEATTVDTTNGTPTLPLTIGNTSRNATYASGSGSAALVFSYVIQAGDTDTDGIAPASPLVLNNGTINTNGTTSSLVFTPPTMSAVFVDTTAPTITVGQPSASSATTGPITYSVTYADAAKVTSTLAVGDITLNKTGSASGTVSVDAGNGVTRTVTISNITGTGTLGITIAAGTAADVAVNTAPASSASTTFSVDNTPTQSLQAYLKGSVTASSDQLGQSVAISGDTAVVGASYQDNGKGSVYVFVRSNGVWTQQAKLTASNGDFGDFFGSAVAISGETIVIGAIGEASGVPANPSDNSQQGAGAVYVFTRTNGIWTQQAYLKASNLEAADTFGSAVAVDGDTVVIGAPHESSSTPGVNQTSNELAPDSGAAYVFTRTNGIWTQQAYLKASNPDGAASIIGEDPFLPPLLVDGDAFGTSVAVSGDMVIVGAPVEGSSATGIGGNQSDNSAGGAGAAYVFTRSNSTWSQQAYLKASDTTPIAAFGFSVALSGNTAVVGSPGKPSGADIGVGAAYVFFWNGSAWAQQGYITASNREKTDNFGFAVAIDTDTVVVGAPGEDGDSAGASKDTNDANNSAPDSGAAYVFTRSATNWTETAYLKASNPGGGVSDYDANPPIFIQGDAFGSAVAISDGSMLVGAPFESSYTTGVDSTPNENALGAGAAYAYFTSGQAATSPTVTSISPITGDPTGGTSVTIHGTGFFGATGVTIGGTAVTSFSVIDDNIIMATTAARAEGTGLSVVVTTPIGSNAANTLFAVSSLTASQQWRLSYFGSSNDGSNDADPDGDGLSNLLEYALGSSPNTRSSGAVLEADAADDRLVLTFNRIADPDLTYTVQGSNDLGNWSDIWTSTGSANVSGPITVRDIVNLSTYPGRALRLKVSIPSIK